MVCSQCGFELRSYDRVCPECGRPVTLVEPMAAPQEEPAVAPPAEPPVGPQVAAQPVQRVYRGEATLPAAPPGVAPVRDDGRVVDWRAMVPSPTAAVLMAIIFAGLYATAGVLAATRSPQLSLALIESGVGRYGFPELDLDAWQWTRLGLCSLAPFGLWTVASLLANAAAGGRAPADAPVFISGAALLPMALWNFILAGMGGEAVQELFRNHPEGMSCALWAGPIVATGFSMLILFAAWTRLLRVRDFVAGLVVPPLLVMAMWVTMKWQATVFESILEIRY